MPAMCQDFIGNTTNKNDLIFIFKELNLIEAIIDKIILKYAQTKYMPAKVKAR